MKERVVIYSKIPDIKRLIKYSKSEGFDVAKVFEKSDKPEKGELFDVLNFSTDNNIHKIIIASCTTLYKNISEFLLCVSELNDGGVSVYFHDENLETLNPDGSVNMTLKVVFDILKEFEDRYKQQIRDRLQKAFKSYIDNGGQVGRKVGFKKPTIQYRMDYARELNLLREGYSLRECRTITGTSINTLRKLKAMFV